MPHSAAGKHEKEFAEFNNKSNNLEHFVLVYHMRGINPRSSCGIVGYLVLFMLADGCFQNVQAILA